MARPKREINWDIVRKYMECGCSGVQIAAKLRLAKDTFYNRFKKEFRKGFQDYYEDGHSVGKLDIRVMLYAKAMNNKAPGNADLLKFLAKCELGMKEPEVTHTLAANQAQIDQSHLIMQLQHEIEELKIANKSQTK